MHRISYVVSIAWYALYNSQPHVLARPVNRLVLALRYSMLQVRGTSAI